MKNVFLVGMPSSGKSTLGRALAPQLGYRFVDLDTLIAQDQGKDIPAIFSECGESYFREVEKRLLQNILPGQGLMVATGGGAPCFFDNMDFILRSGISIYLEVPVDELARRIQAHNQDDRPLLSGITSLEAELARKLESRKKFYTRAHLTVRPETSPDELLSLISRLLEAPSSEKAG